MIIHRYFNVEYQDKQTWQKHLAASLNFLDMTPNLDKLCWNLHFPLKVGLFTWFVYTKVSKYPFIYTGQLQNP